jgi:spermidine synthase
MTASRTVTRACLFVTGAVTIALELIASRILTPYVGGSLYVWTAILSITLLALAAGYHLGGRWSRLPLRGKLFVRFPATTALVLCATALVYPVVLPSVAYDDALSGAFIGSVLLLGPTLVLLSALGPLAIALTASEHGDRGAGAVFAISTVGSVAGALAGAFLLLPFMAPAAALVVLGGVLAGVSVVGLILVGDRVTALGLLPASALAVAGVGVTLFTPPSSAPLGPTMTMHHVDTIRSAHSTVVVVDVAHDTTPGTIRLYLEENQMQSAAALDGAPGSPLFYAAVSQQVMDAMVPADGRILVLGLAGGTLASDLARTGRQVEAVDINPHAPAIASRWFGFDPVQVPVTIGDARRVLRSCRGGYDAILFDVFSGLSVPDHLVTQETFALAAGCLSPTGILVANTIVPPRDTRPTQRLMAAMATGIGGDVAVYEEGAGASARHNRIMVVGRDGRHPPPVMLQAYPVSLFERRARAIMPVLVTRKALLATAAPLTDRSNDFALGLARMSRELAFFPIPESWH